MRFSKVKWNGKKAHMEWTTPNGEDTEVHTLDSTDEPLAGFTDALETIAKHVPRLVGARADYANSLAVTGVSLGVDPNTERRTVIFHCRKDVASTGSAFNFNTPRIQEADPDLDEEDGKYLPEEAAKAVDRLIQEAAAYVEGSRAQGELALDGPADEEPQEDEGFGDEDVAAEAETMEADARRQEMAAVE